MKLTTIRCGRWVSRAGAGMAAAGVILAAAVAAAFGQTIGPDKKIISAGSDIRTADNVRANVAALERAPFDGICINAYTRKNGKVEPFILRVMDPVPIRYDDLAESAADMKATPFKRFTDNFIWAWIAPAPGIASVDFFDDYQVVVENWRTAARVAKEGGLRGLFVDSEQYDTPWGPFAWTRVKYSGTKTKAEYAAQARRRGAEVMRAVNEVYPDIHMLWFFGYSAGGAARTRVGAYAFVADFIDGMLDVAGPEARIIDGFESSYGYKTAAFFEAARDLMKNAMKKTAPAADRFERLHQAGFGLWLDNHGLVIGWNPADFMKNYFTPREFEYSLHQALARTDRYVWVWFERGSFLNGSNLPWPYFRALEDARKPHPDPPPNIPMLMSPGAPPPLEIKGFSGEDPEELLGSKYRLLAELPRRWPWKPDHRGRGFEEKWFAPELDDSGWRLLLTGIEHWEVEGYKYECSSWFRQRWDAPPLPFGEKIYLLFESIDEKIWIWVEGRPIEAGRVARAANGKALLVDVTGFVRSNIMNNLTIRRASGLEPGGGWRRILLVAGK